MHVDLPLDIKTVENEEWATGPPNLRAAGPPGRRGPWAAGRWAFGPPGRGGPWAAGRWAAGLLLAKPGDRIVTVRIKTLKSFVNFGEH